MMITDEHSSLGHWASLLYASELSRKPLRISRRGQVQHSLQQQGRHFMYVICLEQSMVLLLVQTVVQAGNARLSEVCKESVVVNRSLGLSFVVQIHHQGVVGIHPLE